VRSGKPSNQIFSVVPRESENRHAGLDPASTLFASVTKEEGGPRIKSGVTTIAS
jgi:hypothetical protein